MRACCLITLLLTLPLRSAEPDAVWDGRESVAAYAQRSHLDAEKSIDLGGGVKLELVLIPAGQFIMGTPEPPKPEITVISAQVLLGIGALLSLALLAVMFLRKRPGHRFSVSLRWLLAFCLTCGVMVGGGTRWYLARVQNREYAAAMAAYEGVPIDEKPAHPVLISKAFYMGKYVVTQEQYEALMGQNPSHFKGARLPVETVSWDDASVFLKKLNERLAGLALEALLPTEAQWEYACRAGTTTEFNTGNMLTSDQANFDWSQSYNGSPTKVASAATTPVGSFKPNAFGLYDMHGNVCQWCQDVFQGHFEKLGTIDPFNDSKGAFRVLRGGSWNYCPRFCRSAFRHYVKPEFRDSVFGFRLAVSLSRTR